MDAGCQAVEESARGRIMRVGEPGVVAFAFTGRVGEDLMSGPGEGLVLARHMLAGVNQTAQTLYEPPFHGLAWQLAGERIERGMQQRHVQHRVLAQQRLQDARLTHRSQPFQSPHHIGHSMPPPAVITLY